MEIIGKFILHFSCFKKVVVVAVLLLVMLFAIVVCAEVDDTCPVSRCSDESPTIRYPFWLKQNNTQPANDCAFPPGFQLSCGRGQGKRLHNDHNNTIMEFQHLVNTSIKGLHLSFHYKATVNYISYTSEYIQLSDTPYLSDIVPTHLPVNSSFEPNRILHYLDDCYSHRYYYPDREEHNSFFKCPNGSYDCHIDEVITGYTFFNCSSSSSKVTDMSLHDEIILIGSLSTREFHVYAFYYNSSVIEMLPNIESCTKMYTISSNFPYFLRSCSNWRWSKPAGSGRCEAVQNNCKFNDDHKDTKYFGPPPRGSGAEKTELLVAIILPCIFLVVLGFVFLYYYIRLDKQKKEDELKIKMFMEDYRALKPTRYSYSDIKKMTNMFKHKLGQGGYGSVFKGQISSDIIVAVKVLHSNPKATGDDFINEVGTIGKIHHVNVVRLLGYCADGCNQALVYEFQPNHSLEKFVYRREKQQRFIGWHKMQKIALGVAKGIDYLHQGCARQILHFDIKPNNILLDRNFNPKISDFGLAKLCNKGQNVVSMSMARGTIGYIAPEVFSRNFGQVSSKSDVYSFGMLLLEMVGGKKNNNAQEQNNSEVYFPEWIFNELEKGGQVAIQVENEDDSKISRKLTIVGLWCIGWHPTDRPSMKLVIQMLKRDECPAIPPNPFSSATLGNTKSFFSEKLEVISETD